MNLDYSVLMSDLDKNIEKNLSFCPFSFHPRFSKRQHYVSWISVDEDENSD